MHLLTNFYILLYQMTMRNALAGCCLILLFASCGSMQRAVDSLPAEAPAVIVNPQLRIPAKQARVSINFAEQIGDFLVLDVTYSGGCAEHAFDVVSKGKYTATYPPEIEITLTHDDKGDGCRSIIDEKKYFDLRPLQYQGTNKVLLVLTNTNKTLEYNY